ncbi:MAG: hypothetical protein Q9162_007383 [Coniocarpon cinnabarinum]
MCSADCLLVLIAIIFPPLPVWIKRGLCSADSIINIALCVLGFLPGLIHAWYIISVTPDDYEYRQVAQEDVERDGNVSYYYVTGPHAVPPAQQGAHQSDQPNYGTAGPAQPVNTQSEGQQGGAGGNGDVPPSYNDAVAQEALSKYAFEELCMSYNGGKDCLVLLVIYLAAMHTHFSSRLSISGDSDASATTNGLSESHEAASSHFPNSVKCVYIQPAHPFSEVDDFVHNSAADYHLDLATSHKPMKAAFAEYLQDRTEVKAIFVGTRRTDPHGASLTHFDPTDRGWPSFMRIHPVIDWHYQEIWAFIRHLQIPYCQLYDMGYTSLGGTNNTHPNPKLGVAQQDGSGQMTGQIIFRPAYELQDDHEERLGRS